MENRVTHIAQVGSSHAKFYDQFWNLEEVIISEFDEVRVQFFQAVIEKHTPAKDLRILDLGCGTGWLSLFLSQYGAVTGIDYSEKRSLLPENILPSMDAFGLLILSRSG